MKILVNNNKVVSDYLGFKVEIYEDLVQNTKCKKFIEENSKYFNSFDEKDFIEFYKKTGIVIEREVDFMNYINLYGVDRNLFYKKIYSAHLTIIDGIDIKNDIIYSNHKEIKNLIKASENYKMRRTKFGEFSIELKNYIFNTYEEFESNKNELILNNKQLFENYKEIENTEMLSVTPYNDVLTLTSDGILYCNDKIYRKDAEFIFEENSMNKIIIYKNNSIEYITANFKGPLNMEYDKILYSNSYLATLKNGKFEIIIKDTPNYLENRSHVQVFEGIDDIEYYNNEEIILTVGKNKINLPIIDNHIRNCR